MAEGNWQCGMCAAYNEPSKHVCMVCDTFRELGTRGADPGSGDLLAPTQDMFGVASPEPVEVQPPEAAEDLPPVRVMEPPPTRPGGTRLPEPETVPAAEPRRASEGRAGPVPGAEPEPAAGWWEWQADTEPVPVPVATGPEPGSRVTEPSPAVSGRDASAHRISGRWSLPRWPQGTARALALAAVGGVVLFLAWVLPGLEEEAPGPAEGQERGRECPERIAAHVPGAGQGVLVDAFQTERHRIVLCANGAGELYYFGEFLDGNGEVMVVPAERTDEGYVADAGQTRYEIGGGEVVITGENGAEIARLPLEPVPDPE
jgi:hypothetical protein